MFQILRTPLLINTETTIGTYIETLSFAIVILNNLLNVRVKRKLIYDYKDGGDGDDVALKREKKVKEYLVYRIWREFCECFSGFFFFIFIFYFYFLFLFFIFYFLFLCLFFAYSIELLICYF